MTHARLALHDVCGSLNDLLKKLDGSKGDVWLSALNKFLRRENPWLGRSRDISKLPIWMHICHKGLRPDFKNAADVRQTFEERGMKVVNITYDLLNEPGVTVMTEEDEVNFVRLSNADLGRPEGCQLQETYELGVALGLELCEPGDAAHVRLQYVNQPHGGFLLMAMQAISDIHGPPQKIFSMTNHHGSPYLEVCCGDPKYMCGGECEFVFRLPREKNVIT